MNANKDLTSPSHWNRYWEQQRVPQGDTSQRQRWWSTGGYRTRKQSEAIRDLLTTTPPSGRRLLEVGCGNTFWLPRLAKEFDFEPFGIDYEEVGCEMARQQLSSHGVEGQIILADLFEPPAELLGSFDLVTSFGVVEHFTDPVFTFRALQRLMKPGALLLTSVPNLSGWQGKAQRFLCRSLYDVHVPHSAQTIRLAQKAAGLRVIDVRYVMLHDFMACETDPGEPHAGKRWLQESVYKALRLWTTAAMIFDARIGGYPVNARTGSYIISLAQSH